MIDQQSPLPPARQDMPAEHQDARRVHLMAEMAEMAGMAGSRRRLPGGGRRWAIGGLATAGLAGAMAAAMIAVPDAGPDGGQGGGGSTPAIVPVSAVEVLDRAAATVGRTAEPRPDQYVYTETEQRDRHPVANTIQSKSWRSVSGKRVGLIMDSGNWNERFWMCEAALRKNSTGKEPKKLPEVDPSKVPGDCRNTPFYRRDLPGDPKAMRAWLYRNSQGGNPPDVQVFHTVEETVSGVRLTPAAQAAIFKATGTLPGVTVSRVSPTAIAVGQTWNGIRLELIFEAKTYRLLGTRQVVDHDRSFQPKGGKKYPKGRGPSESAEMAGMKPGTLLRQWTIVKQTVVDEIPAKYKR
ncbi:CU044_5270 family protein [Actinomadura sp. 6N118]|uniref:CU044_5270 family protein n=1 Tax=Actinomadura sp. 6N118 TaxID=3375151 RepID=UPI0037B0A8EE